MRLVRGDDDILLALSASEAAHLREACALVVLAAESVPQATLPPELAALLHTLFVSLGDGQPCPQPSNPAGDQGGAAAGGSGSGGQ